MNLKVRLKNKTFWLTAIPATITFVYTILSLFDIVPGISEAVLIKIATMVISALSVLCIRSSLFSSLVFCLSVFSDPAQSDQYRHF